MTEFNHTQKNERHSAWPVLSTHQERSNAMSKLSRRTLVTSAAALPALAVPAMAAQATPASRVHICHPILSSRCCIMSVRGTWTATGEICPGPRSKHFRERVERDRRSRLKVTGRRTVAEPGCAGCGTVLTIGFTTSSMELMEHKAKTLAEFGGARPRIVLDHSDKTIGALPPG